MRRKWYSILLVVCIACFTSRAQAFVSWQFDMKGGAFMPNLDDWSEYYGSSLAPSGSTNLSLSLFRIVQLGADFTYIRDSGVGQFVSGGQAGGEVSYELLPSNLYVGAQAQISDGQWVIPYAGFAYGRSFYRQTIEYQDDVRGAVNGYVIKGGVKLLMDKLDHSSAKMLKEEFGIRHSYLVLEYQQLSLTAGSVDLGGKFFLGGFAFHF